MRNAPPQRSGRRGFTLIELMVVMAIIAILVGLVAAAVMKYMVEGPKAQARNELVGLEVALNSFYKDYGFYPPSKIVLKEQGNYDTTNQLEKDSVAILTKMFPSLQVNGTPVKWSGVTNNGTYTLEGDECLVWFLQGPTGQGFSDTVLGTNVGIRARGTYYSFPAGRLVTNNSRNSGKFPVFMDPFGNKPYAYLSSYSIFKQNNYNRYGSTDCPTLGVNPYWGNPGQYYNPKTFQIISAGPDSLFGPGNQWIAVNAASMPAAGRDDMTNFYERQMGIY
jgi:prepilin-type N-terminal cleavage/methylation domain-containing protein